MSEWFLGCCFGICLGTITTTIVFGIEGHGFHWPVVLVFTAIAVGVFTFYSGREDA